MSSEALQKRALTDLEKEIGISIVEIGQVSARIATGELLQESFFDAEGHWRLWDESGEPNPEAIHTLAPAIAGFDYEKNEIETRRGLAVRRRMRITLANPQTERKLLLDLLQGKGEEKTGNIYNQNNLNLVMMTPDKVEDIVRRVAMKHPEIPVEQIRQSVEARIQEPMNGDPPMKLIKPNGHVEE